MLRFMLAAAVAACVAALPAHAALDAGATAPDFSATASKAGEVFKFSLADSLAQGPVVLYFYPAAFTPGCTIEAHRFAEATDDFAALGARVIGVSRDDIDTLKKFSVSECRSKFAVAADEDGAITRSYDAVMPGREDYADRISYVIAPDGVILLSFVDGNPAKHVKNTLDAVRRWHDAQASKTSGS